MDLHVMRALNSRITFLAFNLCVCEPVCLSVSVSACVPVNSIIKKQFTPETLNLILHICIIDKCYMKLFIKIGQNCVYRGTQKNSNALRPIEGISDNWIFASLECIRYNKNNIHFCHTQKHVNNRIKYEWHSQLVHRAARNEWLFLEIAKGSFLVILCNF